MILIRKRAIVCSWCSDNHAEGGGHQAYVVIHSIVNSCVHHTMLYTVSITHEVHNNLIVIY